MNYSGTELNGFASISLDRLKKLEALAIAVEAFLNEDKEYYDENLAKLKEAYERLG